jgi:hypothetical protein
MDMFQIDHAAEYRVDLAKPIMRGPFKMLPRDKHTMTGAVLLEITSKNGWEVIADANLT